MFNQRIGLKFGSLVAVAALLLVLGGSLWAQDKPADEEGTEPRKEITTPLDPEKPITIDFVRKDIHVVEHYLQLRKIKGSGNIIFRDSSTGASSEGSYNPELHSMGLRIGSDGQPKRIAGDGEVPATWEDLRRAQGFGR